MDSVPVPEDRRGPITGLPSGVDYACIKRFFLMLPPWMTTLTWLAAPTAEEATWRSFAGKTFRTVDRLLCQREAALAQPTTEETEAERRTVTALRGYWIQQLLDELRRSPAGSLWIGTRQIRVPGPASTTRSVTLVEAWTLEEKRLRLLELRPIAPTAKRWAGERVNYFDPDAVHAALAEVLRTHARGLLRRRCGTRWRSHRRPAGWPIITRYAIPWLYDYLRPCYPVCGYRHRRQHPSPGHYPVKLRHDILSILRFERPISRTISPSRTSRRPFSITSGQPHRTAAMGNKLCADLRRIGRSKPEVTF
jgi:hypothetical protein